MSALDPSYITLRQFAEQRGMRTDKIAMQRLRRRLVKKQAKHPALFLLRLSDAPNEPLYTTIPLMREHCPEFFDRRSELEQLVKKKIDELNATNNRQIKELISRQSALASKLREYRSLLDECLKALQSASPPGIG